MATRSDEEVRGLISAITADLLRNAADSTQTERLKRKIRDWYPNQDAVDEFELRRLTSMVQDGLGGMARLVEDRFERLVEQGRAKPVPRRIAA